ncbi:MAG: hypothetical protein QME61_01930 [Patescibacteria group bacterium]|nr:hypothetical protein [Patescibacteria group bacterium]
MNGRVLVCANPKCRKRFYRPIGKIEKVKMSFCSRSCAASVNNSKFSKRKVKIKKCIYCNKEFKGDSEKYCSRECKDKAQTISKEEI